MTKFMFAADTDKKQGRPVDTERMDSFEKICKWVDKEGDCAKFTIRDLQEQIKKTSKEAYTAQYMKQNSKEHYGEYIYFSEFPGRSDIICFKELADFILNEKKKKNGETKENITQAVAKIIKAEMREMSKSNVEYPTVQDIQGIDKGMGWVLES